MRYRFLNDIDVLSYTIGYKYTYKIFVFGFTDVFTYVDMFVFGFFSWLFFCHNKIPVYSYAGICNDVRLCSFVLIERFSFRFGHVLEICNTMYIFFPSQSGVTDMFLLLCQLGAMYLDIATIPSQYLTCDSYVCMRYNSVDNGSAMFFGMSQDLQTHRPV